VQHRPLLGRERIALPGLDHLDTNSAWPGATRARSCAGVLAAAAASTTRSAARTAARMCPAASCRRSPADPALAPGAGSGTNAGSASTRSHTRPARSGLGLQVPAAYGAFVGVEHVAAQCVHALARIELLGDLAAVVLPGQVAGGVAGTTQRPVLLERGGGEGILPVSAQDSLPTTNDAVPCPYIQRRRHPQHLVPVLGDQHRVEPAGQQRPGDRVAGGALGSRSGPVEGDPAQVPDPGDSCSPTSYPVDPSPPGQQARAFGPNTQPRGATPGASRDVATTPGVRHRGRRSGWGSRVVVRPRWSRVRGWTSRRCL